MHSETMARLMESVRQSAQGLSARLTGLFLLLALTPLAIVAVVVLQDRQAALEEHIGLQLSIQAEHVVEGLEELVENEQASLKDWAMLSVLDDLIRNDAGGRISETLAVLAQGQPIRSSLMAISPSGKVVAASRPDLIGQSVGGQAWFQRKPDASHRKGWPFQEKVAERGYYFVAPILREGKRQPLIGYLSAHLSQEQLENHVRAVLARLSTQSNGARSSVFLFNDEQGVTFLSRSETDQAPAKSARDLFSLDQLRQLPESPAEESSPLRTWALLTARDGQQFLVGHAGAQDRAREGGFVAVARPLDEVYEPIYALWRKIIGLGLSLVAVVLAVAFLVSARLSRPIRQLTICAEAVASGNFAPGALPIGRQDEIGALARAFDHMREDLRLLARDLEERVQARTGELESAHRQLQRQHAFLRQVVDINPSFIFVKDRDGQFTLANQAVADAYGVSVENLIGKIDADFGLPADQVERSRRDDLDVLNSGREKIITEEAFTDAAGGVRWLRTVKRPLSAQSMGQGQVLGVAVDITALREAIQAVSVSEERFHQMVSQVKDCAIVMLGPDGSVVHWNDGAERIKGYAEDDILGRHFSCFFPAEHIQTGKPAQLLVLAIERGSVEDEGWLLRKDGSKFWAHVTITPVRDDAGQLIGFSKLTRDLTKQKESERDKALLEAQLRQAQKMEAVGRLAGGIAHDFNNLLTVITGFSQILELSIKPDDRLHQAVVEITKAAERAANLTQQLLAFSRKQVIQPTQLSLNEVVAQIEKMLRQLIGEDIRLESILASDLSPVKADRGQMDQIIMNLAVNARDAMPKGGRLLLRTSNVLITPERREPMGIVPPGCYVCLEVRDSGCGMDEATMAQVFEPFFTTKEPGKGTGLGLATVYGIVKQSGGFITVESDLGKGAAFFIYFPPILPEAQPQPYADGTRLIRTPGKKDEATILLVEDEGGIRLLFQELLASYGYQVLTASDGEAGCVVGSSHSGTIDLLVTDVVMPKLSGAEMAQRLLGKYPKLKVLYMSGYADESIVQHGVLEPGIAFLSKPFKPQVLVDRVRQILAAA
jgi:PAS domain S-box-containing protein